MNEIKKEFKTINAKRTYLNLNSTCFLNPKFLLVGKHTLIPNYVRKGKINKKIPVRIIGNSFYGYYKIKICSNYKDKKNNLKSGEEYISDSKLLKKINEKTWRSICAEN